MTPILLIPCDITQWIDENTLAFISIIVGVIGIIITILSIVGIKITLPHTRKWRKEQIKCIPNDFYGYYPNKNYIPPYFSFLDTEKNEHIKHLLHDYFIKEVFIKNTKEPSLFCILGDTGTGKTAALVHLFTNYINCHTPKDLPYSIKIFSLRRNSTLDDIDRITDRKKCILLLDAMDENPIAQNPDQRADFIQKINEACQDFAFIVLTCRPQFFDNDISASTQIVLHKGEHWFNNTLLKLSDFNDDQVHEYLEKEFTSPSDNELRSKAEEIVNKHAFIAIRPMVLTHIRELVESKREINTALDFYDTIVHNWILRELKKKSPIINKESIQQWWEMTSDVAGYIYLKTNGTTEDLSIKKEELHDIFQYQHNDELANFLSSINISLPHKRRDETQFLQRSMLTRTNDAFHFSHKSYYEYFMAYRFFLHPEEIDNVCGMDFALQLYNEIHNAYNEKRQILFADLSQQTEENIAMSLNNIGNGLHKIYNYQEAEFKIQEALKIYRRLHEHDQNAYLSSIATTLTDLADLHKKTMKYVGNDVFVAEKEYKEALNICRQLVKKEKEIHLPDLARILNNLASLHREMFKKNDAETEYNEALSIYRQLAVQNPKEYLPDVAMILTNLARLHKTSMYYNINTIEEEYKDALNIYEQLVEQDIDFPVQNLASLWDSLATLYRENKIYDNAEEEYNKALFIRRSLAEDNPDEYLPDVAKTLGNISLIYRDKKNFPAAEAAAQESLDIFLTMAEKNPAVFDKYVGKAEELLERIKKMKESNE